jgi:hypothetical protein
MTQLRLTFKEELAPEFAALLPHVDEPQRGLALGVPVRWVTAASK